MLQRFKDVFPIFEVYHYQDNNKIYSTDFQRTITEHSQCLQTQIILRLILKYRDCEKRQNNKNNF